MTLRQWLQEQVHLVVWSLSIHHASVALANLFFRICGGTKGFLHGFFYMIYVRLYKRLDLEAVSGAKCETSDGTAWLPRHMFTRRRRQKDLHAQNISWYQLTHNRLRLFWDVLGLLKNLELLGSVFPQFRMSGAQCLMTSWRPCYNAAWICSETGNCIRKLGGEVMKTPGMMICERSILHKAEAHFHPFASQLREWFQQKQQWLPVVPHKAVAEVSKIGNL